MGDEDRRALSLRRLQHKEIDQDRWDEALARSAFPMAYADSGYLNALSPDWQAVVSEDYAWLVPLPMSRKFQFIQQVASPFFMQQLGLFGPDPTRVMILQQAFSLLPSTCIRLRLKLNEANGSPNFTGFETMLKPNFILALNQPYAELEKGYNKSLRKRIRSASDHLLLENNPFTPRELVDWYRRQQGPKAHLNERDYARLNTAMVHALRQKKGFIWGCRDRRDGQIRAACFYLNQFGRVINLFGASDPEGKASFAMHFLVDQVVRHFSEQEVVLDFEGSSLPGVATFFESFGSQNHPYAYVSGWRIPGFSKL